MSHENEIPKRSQQSGSAEVSIKILKQGLARICAGKIEGRKNWPDSLPKLIQTINSYYPYKSKLSRVQLLFSPYYNCSTRLDVKNPLKLQRSQYKELNAKRIQNMFEKGQGLRPREFAIGNYVALNDGNSTTIEGSRQLNFPGSKELYKIIQINKKGFSLTLLNIRNPSSTHSLTL